MHNLKIKQRGLIWLVSFILTLFLCFKIYPQFKIEGSVTSLLENKQLSPQVEQALSANINNTILWLVGNKDLNVAENMATLFSQRLIAVTGLSNIEGKDIKQQQDWQTYIFQNRAMLLNENIIAQLKDKNNYFNQILSQLYSLFSGVSAQEIKNDPLLLTRKKILDNQQNLQAKNGWIYIYSDHTYYILLRAKVTAIGIEQKHQLVDTINSTRLDLIKKYPGSVIYQRGALFFSDISAQSVKRDITIIGLGSILGIVVLLWLAFRSLYPLWLMLISLFTGVLWGGIATWFIFGEIHLLTLALSTSLVGVSADYSLHFITERYFSSEIESSLSVAKKLFLTLGLAFLTTASCYLIMLFAPLAILKQMAIYAVFGLLGALFTVLMLYPYLTQSIHTKEFKMEKFIEKYLHFWQKSRIPLGIIFVLLIISGYAVTKLKVNDDVHLLQNIPEQLKVQDKKITQILQQGNELQYFILEGKSAENLLENTEKFMQELTNVQIKNVIKPSVIITNYIQSAHRQQENWRIVENTLDFVRPQLEKQGFNIIDHYPKDIITLSEFLDRPVGQQFKPLFYTDKGKYYLLIPLSEVKDIGVARDLAKNNPNLYYYNLADNWSKLFAQSRDHIIVILFASLVLIGFILTLITNWRMAIAIVGVIIFAMLLAIAVLSLTGQVFNLFSALALILILGMGVDYGIFLSKNSHFLSSSFLAVILSALTTQLSFGLLLLSSTQALVSFATILSVGILIAFVFMPIILRVTTNQN